MTVKRGLLRRSVLNLPGCASAEDTEGEARRNMKEAIQLYFKPSGLDLTALPNQLDS